MDPKLWRRAENWKRVETLSGKEEKRARLEETILNSAEIFFRL